MIQKLVRISLTPFQLHRDIKPTNIHSFELPLTRHRIGSLFEVLFFAVDLDEDLPDVVRVILTVNEIPQVRAISTLTKSIKVHACYYLEHISSQINLP